MRAIGLVLLSIAIMALLLTDADAKRRSSAQASQAVRASRSWCATYSWKGIKHNFSFATQQQWLAQERGLGGVYRPNAFPGTAKRTGYTWGQAGKSSGEHAAELNCSRRNATLLGRNVEQDGGGAKLNGYARAHSPSQVLFQLDDPYLSPRLLTCRTETTAQVFHECGKYPVEPRCHIFGTGFDCEYSLNYVADRVPKYLLLFGREATVTQVHLPDAFCQELPQISFYARLVRPVHLGQQHPRYHQRNACLRQRHEKSLIPPEELLPEHLSPLAFGSVAFKLDPHCGAQSKSHIRSKETHMTRNIMAPCPSLRYAALKR